MNYVEIANRISKKYYDRKDLVGIVLIGSSTYGIEDEFVDVDIRILISKDKKNNPMEQFEFEGAQIEVDEMSLNWLLTNTDFDSEQSWIRQNAVILYDPNNQIVNMFKKSNKKSEAEKDKLFWRTYSEIFNRHDLKKCIKRSENIAAYMYICKTIEMLTKFVFLLNNKPVPTFKWRCFFIKKYELFSIERIENIIPKGITTDNLTKSLEEIKKLQQELQNEMIENGYERDRVMEPWRF